MPDRRFVTFVCTGRGTHKERRLRRFRWEPIAETIAAGPGPIYGPGDIESWNEWVDELRQQLDSGVIEHLVEDDRVRDVDGRPVSYIGDLDAYAAGAGRSGEARYGTRAMVCPTCKNNLPFKEARLVAVVQACMAIGRWEFDISGVTG